MRWATSNLNAIHLHIAVIVSSSSPMNGNALLFRRFAIYIFFSSAIASSSLLSVGASNKQLPRCCYYQKSVRIFGREKCWCGFNAWLCASHFRVRSLCAHSFEVAKHLLISNSCTSLPLPRNLNWYAAANSDCRSPNAQIEYYRSISTTAGRRCRHHHHHHRQWKRF